MKAIINILYIVVIVCITYQLNGNEPTALYSCEKPHTESHTGNRECNSINHPAEEEVHAALINCTGSIILSADEKVIPVNPGTPANLNYSIWLPPDNSTLSS